MRFRFFPIAALVCLSFVEASPFENLSPRQILQRFDSLLNIGANGEAKSLCTGTALRMFPFWVEAQHKLNPLIDSTRSRDTVVEEKQSGQWSALKVVSDVVFRKPMMGLDRMHSVQAVHLFRQTGGWKLAEFEELQTEKSILVLRSGIPTGADTVSPGSLFPVSHRASDQQGITRMRLRVSLRSGDSLPGLPQSAGQKILQRGGSWALIETSRPVFSGDSKPRPDSLKKYLGSGSYLDLDDSLLLAKAAELRLGVKDANGGEVARRIYHFVSSSFHFQLGAALFSDSREALRSLNGDCSEAAMLTAALLRAEGIPSRVAMGFATLGRGVFIGHAWAEAYLDGRWIGVDAALREFPAGAARVMLVQLSGSEDMRVAASNLMLQSLSNLDIEIEAAWAGSKPLPLVEQHGDPEEGRAFFEEVLKGVGK